MNQKIVSLFSFSLFAALLLTSCQTESKSLVPVTGAQDMVLSAPSAAARDSVLSYLVSSARLADLPASANWQSEESRHEGEHRYRSGDWLMLIRLAEAGQPNQKIILLNPVEQRSWSGYVTPEGRVVETSYGR